MARFTASDVSDCNLMGGIAPLRGVDSTIASLRLLVQFSALLIATSGRIRNCSLAVELL